VGRGGLLWSGVAEGRGCARRGGGVFAWLKVVKGGSMVKRSLGWFAVRGVVGLVA
jgi:hypothetical protein